MNFFIYDSSKFKLKLNTPEIFLVQEFKFLVEHRLKQKKDPMKDFTYIFLAIDWQSIYGQFEANEKHKYALSDSELSEDDFKDPIFQTACAKYQEIQNSNRAVRTYNVYKEVHDKLLVRNQNIDLEREGEDGKPIYKSKEIIEEIGKAKELLLALEGLEDAVKNSMYQTSSIRGGALEGFIPTM